MSYFAHTLRPSVNLDRIIKKNKKIIQGERLSHVIYSFLSNPENESCPERPFP